MTTGFGWSPAAEPTLTVTVASTGEEQAPEPDDVVAGWSGFVVIALLAVATGFLIRSMRKQLRRIDFDEGPDQQRDGDDGPRR